MSQERSRERAQLCAQEEWCLDNSGELSTSDSSRVTVLRHDEKDTAQFRLPDHLKKRPASSMLEANNDISVERIRLESILQGLVVHRDSLVDAANVLFVVDETAASGKDVEASLQLALTSAKSVIGQRVARLTSYNSIKDIGQNLMGLIAEQQGSCIREVMERFGLNEGD